MTSLNIIFEKSVKLEGVYNYDQILAIQEAEMLFHLSYLASSRTDKEPPEKLRSEEYEETAEKLLKEAGLIYVYDSGLISRKRIYKSLP